MKRRALVAAVFLWLAPARADGDPAKHFHTPAHCDTDGGAHVDLPPGFFYDEAARAALDAEFKRLQDAETRLTAENGSLRRSADPLPIGWKTLVAGLSAGVVGGFVAGILYARK